MNRARLNRARRRPILVGVSALIAAALILPEVFLLLQAKSVGWPTLHRVLFRRLSLQLLTNTVELAVVVTVVTALIGTATAWCIERTNLPGRRVWAVLVILPAAVPDFIIGYTWHSAVPSLAGLRGASLVMSLDLYPLVYLPVGAAFRRIDPTLEEVGRSLGLNSWQVFFRVVLPQIRTALLGAGLVVMLALLAEFGAFEIMRFQTFTTAIFTEFKVDQAAASALSLLLVLIGIIVLAGEVTLRAKTPNVRSGSQVSRPTTRRQLGRSAVPVLLGFTVLVWLALGVPLSTLVYWLTQHQRSTLPAASTLLSATLTTARYAVSAAALCTLAAVPVAVMAAQKRGRLAALIERSTYLIQSVPGVVVALGLVFFTVRYSYVLYQTSFLLIIAYAMLFFPLALVCVRASAEQISPQLAEVGRSLGCTQLSVFFRITLPLIAPGLAAGFCLVFLAAVTELTATLLLIPTGAQTLATQFWAYQSNTSYAAAAPYATTIVAIAAVPSVVLGTWFARRVRPNEQVVVAGV